MPLKLARRALGLCLLFLTLFCALGFRLFRIGVQESEALARQAYAARTLTWPLAPPRGAIRDRFGAPLSNSAPTTGVVAFPPLMGDAGTTAARLAQSLGQDPAALNRKLRDSRGQVLRRAVQLADGLSEAAAGQVRALGLPGIFVVPVYQRFGTPPLALHLLGAVNQGDRGVSGLERLYDDLLRGEDVPTLALALDGRGQLLEGGLKTVVPATGHVPADVHTTLDRSVQGAVEAALDTRSGLKGAAVVVDARTGEVLAAASRPDGQWSQAVSGTYPPGSTFKPFVAAEAIELGLARLDDSFDCPGHYELGDAHFKEAHNAVHGHLTLKEAVAQSCNITFIKVGYELLGKDRLLDAARRFGFGSPTGVGLPEEATGHLPALKYEGEVAQFAFGQADFTVTPLQVARAYAALANGGVLPTLKLVTVVKDPSGRVLARPDAGESHRVISAETARQVREALLAVTDHGTGIAAQLPQVGAAGKTGTAEDGDPSDTAWFAGYFPADQPRYVVVVVAQHGGYGNQVAAPLFAEIGRRILAIPGY